MKTILIFIILSIQIFAQSWPDSNRTYLTLPPKIYISAGDTLNVFFEDITLNKNLSKFTFTPTYNTVKVIIDSIKIQIITSTSDTGEHSFAIESYNDSTGISEISYSTLIVTPVKFNYSDTLNLMMVGNSLTSPGIYPETLINKILSYSTKINSFGTKSISDSIRFEGHSGKTWGWFLKDKLSPFVLNEKFDFENYLDNICNNQQIDLITFLLGINDCFAANPSDTTTIDTKVDEVFGNMMEVLNSIREILPRVKFGILLTPTPNLRDTSFINNYPTGRRRWEWKRIQHRLVQRYISKFQNKEEFGYYLVPINISIDPLNHYPELNSVHPNTAGYKNIAKDMFSWLNAIYKNEITVGIKEPIYNIPNDISISENYPNPFNPSTNFTINLPYESVVNYSVYNVLGQQVLRSDNLRFNQGVNQIHIDLSNSPSGIYIVNFTNNASTRITSKKILLLK